MTGPLHWLVPAAQARRAAGLERTLRVREAGAGRLLDLAGNDYLAAVATPPTVVAAAASAAAQDFGAGATGSRLVTGTTALHEALEQALAAHVGVPSALVFSSGYLANLGACTALAGPGTLVVSDARQPRVARRRLPAVARAARRRAAPATSTPSSGPSPGARGAGARRHRRRLQRQPDGSRRSPALHAAVRRAGARAARRRGARARRGRAGRTRCRGGARAGRRARRRPHGHAVQGARQRRAASCSAPSPSAEHLVDTARPFIFDTGARAAVRQALRSRRCGSSTPARVGGAARGRARHLADALEVPRTDSAVVPVHVGDAARRPRPRGTAALGRGVLRRAASARRRCRGAGVPAADGPRRPDARTTSPSPRRSCGRRSVGP